MSVDATAFGRPTTEGVAKKILASPSLNANPSPDNPQQFPADEKGREYGRLLAAAYKLRQVEKDPLARMELEKCIRFAEQRYTELVENGEQDGAPGLDTYVPNPPPPSPPPQAPPAPGPGPGAPPAAGSPGPTPGGPPATGGIG